MKSLSFLILFFVAACEYEARSQPPYWDSTFNETGYLIEDFSVWDDYFRTITFDTANNSFIVSGSVDGLLNEICLARYDLSGQLVPGFGNGGKVITDIPENWEYLADVTITPDGEIIGVGVYHFEGNFTDLHEKVLLIKYLDNGQLDQTFGEEGISIIDFPNRPERGLGLQLLDDGKMLIGGRRGGSQFNADFALMRCLPNGVIDSTFGIQGLIETDLSGNDDHTKGMLVQPDGKMILYGTYNPGAPAAYELARYLPNGNLDHTFGDNGIVITDLLPGEVARSIELMEDGCILLSGTSGTKKITLLKYTPYGDLHPSFGDNGMAVQEFEEVGGYGSHIALIDKYILQLACTGSASSGDLFTIICYDFHGNLVPGFGTGGIFRFSIGGYFRNNAFEIAVDGDKIYCLGSLVDTIPIGVIDDTPFYKNSNALIARFSLDEFVGLPPEPPAAPAEVMIYPNPAGNNVVVEMVNPPAGIFIREIWLYSQTGGFLSRFDRVNDVKAELDLNGKISTGPYFLGIILSNGEKVYEPVLLFGRE